MILPYVLFNWSPDRQSTAAGVSRSPLRPAVVGAALANAVLDGNPGDKAGRWLITFLPAAPQK